MVEKIVSLARDRGLTQKAVEAQLRLAENRISRWNAGQGEPTARQALAIARLLGVPVEWLIDDTQGGQPATVGRPDAATAWPWEGAKMGLVRISPDVAIDLTTVRDIRAHKSGNGWQVDVHFKEGAPLYLTYETHEELHAFRALIEKIPAFESVGPGGGQTLDPVGGDPSA